jgi:hypothetical protein
MVLAVSIGAISLAQSRQSPPSVTVPRLINISGVFQPADGQPAARVEAITLSIYAEPEGGAPLWQETQSIAIDEAGRYAVLLGATSADGVPPEVFASGDAQWLGIVFARPGEVEGPRVRLTSVPYALRSADADTLGGRPASAYLLAPTNAPREGDEPDAPATPGQLSQPSSVLPGTANFLAKYVNSADVGNSAVYEVAGAVGIGTTSPFDSLHVRFNNTNGGVTGFAVQNLGTGPNAYSGMLFYDQNGSLAQFQGFNNQTHEYRINNVASGGSINFMLGGSSRFQVTNSAINVNTDMSITSGIGLTLNGGNVRPLSTQNDGVEWLTGAGALSARLFKWGFGDQALYVSNNGNADLTGVFLATGATSWTSTSDERLKTNVTPVAGVLKKLENIRVVSFDMAALSSDPTTNRTVADFNISPRTMRSGTTIRQQIGAIAQDWVADFPELVVEPTSDDGYYGLNYDRIGVVALAGVKELTALVAAKDAEIKALNARLAALEQTVERLASQAGQK